MDRKNETETLRKKIYSNVKALARMNGIKMREIEEKLDKSPGYFSRPGKGFTAFDLVTLSEIFHVEIKDLFSRDFAVELYQEALYFDMKDALMIYIVNSALTREAVKKAVETALNELYEEYVGGDENG